MPDDRQPDEFVSLLLRHQFRIYGFILSLVPHSADADDIMQETCAELWRMFEKYDPNADFGAWACGVAKYRVLKFRSRRARLPMCFSDEVLDRIAEAALRSAEEVDAQRSALSRCLQKLTPRDSELLRQVYDPATKTLKQAAEALCRPVNTVYKATSRIHRTLYECAQRRLKADHPSAE